MSKALALGLARERLGGLVDRGTERILDWDEALLETLASSRLLRRIDLLLVVGTYIGYGYLWLALALAMIVFGTTQDHRNLLVGQGVMAVTLGLVHAVKAWGGRPRPAFRRKGFHHQFLTSSSFPSSHAATSFAMAGVVVQLYPWWDGATVFVVAGLIGLSRVYLREHFPLDVLAGALLGLGVALGLTPWFARLVS